MSSPSICCGIGNIYDANIRRYVELCIYREYQLTKEHKLQHYLHLLSKLIDVNITKWNQAFSTGNQEQNKHYFDLCLQSVDSYTRAAELPEVLIILKKDTEDKAKLLESTKEIWESMFGVKIDSDEYKELERKTIENWEHSLKIADEPKKLKILASSQQPSNDTNSSIKP